MSQNSFKNNAKGTFASIQKVREVNNVLRDQHHRMQVSLEQFSIPESFMNEARKNNPYVSPYSH